MTLVRDLFAALEGRGYDLAVAESCTGGGLAAAITDVPGSSIFFLGGVVSYANTAKEALLGVSTETLRDHGAVSEPTARAMAEAGRMRLGASVGISTTGVAGPEGGTVEKPVGLVYIGVATPSGTAVRRDVWPGDRAEVRAATVRAALEFALKRVRGEP